MPLERLLPHLGPTDEEAAAAAKEARQQLDAAIAKIGMTSLTAGGDKVCTAAWGGALHFLWVVLDEDCCAHCACQIWMLRATISLV